MAAEDPRFLLHFKTLAKFNEKLADGTVSADKHLVFIKDAKQVWFKGTYYADNVKMDGITDFYNGWSITQSSATTLTITLTGKRWNANTRAWEAISKPLSVNSATQSIAGLMSAADKVKLDGLNINNVSNISFSSDAAKVTATISKDNGNAADISTTVNLPVASSTSAGSMSATDKIELDRISTANFALGAVTPAASTVGIAATKTTISTGASATNNITLPAATSTTAGVMTSAQVNTLTTVNNRKLFGIVKGDSGTATAEAAVDTLTISGGTDLETVATDTTNNDVLTVNHSSVTRTNAADATATYTLPASGGSVALPKVVKSVTSSATGHVTATSSETPSIVHGALTTAATTGTALTPGFGGKVNVVTSASNDGHGHITGITTTSVTIPSSVASTTANGLMSTADKIKLDTTLPNLISSNKTTIDNYTVNGFKISTNPILDGADIKITGYTKPSTTGALAAADSVNGALGKLEKKLDDEVTNRTNAVSNLTTTVNNNKTTIDNYTINGAKISTNPKITVTVEGSGNAVTTASFSGTVLTLTKGATYNNYSHPAGSGASKSTGLYKFSTDGTSHISGVTAVTKSDITALGIPSSDTNTTYSFSSGTGSFTVTPSGGSAQTVSIGKPSTAGTADKVANTLTFTGYQSKSYNGSAAVSVAIPSRVSDLTNDSGYITSYTDTKNTTGSTDSSSKLYLVGATSQASNPVTYSNSGVYTQGSAVYASAGFYDTSDMRVKDNIESIDVSKADKIRLVEFDRTDREHHGYGVIAQELETVYPSMVNTDENGFKTVNYSEIYAVKIKYLEDKIAALEAIVDKLINK